MSDTSVQAAAWPSERWSRSPFGRYTPEILFVAVALVFSAWPLVPQLLGHGKGKDYALWYNVGSEVLQGSNLYQPGPHGFGFLYPPFAAVLLAPFSLFGRAFSIFCIDVVNVASWWTACKLSERLSGVPGRQAWWVLALPSTLALPMVYDMFDLGQPNLMLLAIMLAGIFFLSTQREWSAGAMFAAAAALKAFPIAVFPYLIWRRRWRAAASMAVMTAVFLALVPAPFRGFERNLSDLRAWAGGMVFSADEKGFGQRPEQNWGWKNNSLIAVTHRYLRPINAEAENPQARPLSVNLLNLTYNQANIVLLAVAAAIGVGFVAVLPPERRRTKASDSAEYALLIALMTIASPLARAYYFVWMIFPFTVLVQHAVANQPAGARRPLAWALIAAMALFAAGIPLGSPHWPQALGSMFWADAIVAGALAWLMRRSMAAPDERPLAAQLS